MTQEEKARAYDKALNIAREILDHTSENYLCTHLTKEDIKDMYIRFFPELKESEDEKIRKSLLEYLHTLPNHYAHSGVCAPEWIAWLEKQGEQKPSDKVEPKFHEGDWIVRELDNTCYQIKKCILNVTNNKCGYDLTDGGYISSLYANFYHLWTIQDAKDGDVLAVEPIDGYPSPFIAIYKERGLDFFNSHCFVSRDGEFHKGTTGHDINLVHPATKEQRDFLFKKMKEAGYKWDADKKESKKISQRMISAEAKEAMYAKTAWSEEDEVKINRIVACLENLNVADNDILLKDVDWLKSLEDRYTWKPGKEQMDALNCARWNAPFNIEILDSLYYDLKKLREE